MASHRYETRFYNKKMFMLGLFGMNCLDGFSLTKTSERWDAYQGESDTQGTTFETLTWACGLLACTKEITTFGTLHVAFVNPVFAAKQMVTADHIGHGRFGLNVVSGWNPIEFGMMGVELGDHDGRYDYSEEWLTIVKRIWFEDKPFDFDGRHYKLKAVMAKPKPWWGSRPILVSAGNSKTGSDFAARNADCLFTTVPGKHEELQPKLKAFRDAAPPGQLRNIFASCHLMVRRTRKEAEDYHHYIVYEQGDWESAEYALNLRGQRVKSWFTTDDEKKMKARLISGAGFPLVGSYDDAVEMMQRLHAAGLDGLALGMINYVNDFPGIRDELLPRMERVGLREPQRHGAAQQQRQDDLVH